MIDANKTMNDWDYLYANGMQGKYPSEMLLRFVNSKLRNKQHVKILDIGCGTGRHLSYFNEQNYDVYGIDCSSAAIKIATEWLKSKNMSANISLGSVMDHDLYVKNTDAVTDVACMQHNLLKDMEKIVANVYDSLNDSGYFFSITKTQDDSLYSSGEFIEGSTRLFQSNAEKVNVSVIITFLSLDDVFALFNKFSAVNVEKEEWTFADRSKKVSHWIITAQK